MEQASLQAGKPLDKPSLSLHRKFHVAPEKVVYCVGAWHPAQDGPIASSVGICVGGNDVATPPGLWQVEQPSTTCG